MIFWIRFDHTQGRMQAPQITILATKTPIALQTVIARVTREALGTLIQEVLWLELALNFPVRPNEIYAHVLL